MKFAELILLVRRKLYLSRSDMAKEMGVIEHTIYRWELGLSKSHISSKGKFMSLCKKEKIKFEDI